MTLQSILTDKAPIPAGHYSQAIIHQGVVYIAGQLPIRPGQKEHLVGSIDEQTRQTLANLDAILVAAGSSREQVLRVTVYVSDVKHWPVVNGVYAEFFGNHRPARTVVPVSKLHYGYEIELDAIAAVG
ncbi:MAG: RidA family protein [Gemmatales bacterium]